MTGEPEPASWCGAQKRSHGLPAWQGPGDPQAPVPLPGPPCSEPPGHEGDHIARDPFGAILQRWRRAVAIVVPPGSLTNPEGGFRSSV